MSAIAYYLESEGLQTTGISLVRENTEALRPPRFLWTSFPLGRPLGVPGDATFQRRVVVAALDLLRRASGPVLEDYPEDAPDDGAAPALACPVGFSRPTAADGWAARLRREVAELAPWHELSRRRRGRTTVGIAGEPVEASAGRLAAIVEGPSLDGLDARALKYAVEDLKAYYREALTAQPGAHDGAALEHLLHADTELGRALHALDARLAADPKRQALRAAFLPRAARHET
ncbi:MAG: hypothetical protein U1E23_14470 [Reyranellaceae bacterium]